MDRRRFISLSASGLLSMALADEMAQLSAKALKNDKEYSIVILGDTHFDTEPASVYHSNYNEKVEWLNRVQRAEFARNGEMWRERCPRLLKRASKLITPDTKMVFQMGDLIQGDCGKGDRCSQRSGIYRRGISLLHHSGAYHNRGLFQTQR